MEVLLREAIFTVKTTEGTEALQVHVHKHTQACLRLMWVSGCIFHAGSQQAELLYCRLTSPV